MESTDDMEDSDALRCRVGVRGVIVKEDSCVRGMARSIICSVLLSDDAPLLSPPPRRSDPQMRGDGDGSVLA